MPQRYGNGGKRCDEHHRIQELLLLHSTMVDGALEKTPDPFVRGAMVSIP